jgi:hypothetical protein
MEYQVINPNTGEIEVFETTVDVGLLEDYNAWVIENKLNPPTYSPQEYAKHLEIKKTLLAVNNALEYLDFYNTGTPFEKEMLDKLVRILKNEE